MDTVSKKKKGKIWNDEEKKTWYDGDRTEHQPVSYNNQNYAK